MEWSIHEVIRFTGTTSRTLRHYGQIGLLAPSRTGHGGLRYYDEDALVRLQRILLLRRLGLSLPAIADVLAGAQDVTDALRTHLALLEREQDRVQRQIASVRRTIERKEGGEHLMAEEMFDGFDHTQHRDEVEARWGQEAYAAGDRWWRALSPEGRRAFQDRSQQLVADWTAAAGRGLAPGSEDAQALARRHVQWLGAAPGAGPTGPGREYVLGLGEMYVSDPRFAATYGGEEKAEFVREALKVHADRHL
jgi:DNA-binding transcriptional MerR regulator